ncbi:MAG TPA: cytochrome c3 family protein [Anaeromyxobacter sp.]
MTIALLLPIPGEAGNWHRGESLVCSDCHTMHGSQSHSWGGTAPVSPTPVPGGDWLSATAPSSKLLKAAPDQLCIACHDGSTSGAPDVIAPVGYVADPAGGAFESTNAPSALGHDLGGTAPVVPPLGNTAVLLTCRTCHDPHGNSSFRNLRPRPSGSPLGVDVPVVVTEGVVANGSNAAQVYVASNLTYRSGTSAWCMDCHDTYADAVTAGTKHSTDRTIYGSISASYAGWTAVSTARVRVENPTEPVVPSQDDRVFCLSCHKAHGSANPSALIYADGITVDSTCVQCHSQHP